MVMEFHVDDTAAEERQDVITEVAFHVPPTNTDFVLSEKAETAAKAFLEQVGSDWALGVGRGQRAVVGWRLCSIGWVVAALHPPPKPQQVHQVTDDSV